MKNFSKKTNTQITKFRLIVAIMRPPMIMSSNAILQNVMNYATTLHLNTIILLMVSLQLLYYVLTGMIAVPFIMQALESLLLNGDFL